MSKSDELRARLPRLAGELDYAIKESLEHIRDALRRAPTPNTDLERGWRKGLLDALTLLKPAHQAREQFRAWMDEVTAQEIDHCGLTAEEREMVLGRK